MKVKIKKIIALTIITVAFVALTLIWYDWKLLIILFMLWWAINFENSNK